MKKNIAILMGGYSSEYQISLKSGAVVYNMLDRSKYNPYSIHIFKDKWVYVDESGNEYPINKDNFTTVIDGQPISFDCVFNAIHGSPGEDGYMQAYFNLLNIPITGCSMYQAALTFNKRDLLATLKPFGIKTAESFYLNLGEVIDEEAIITKVGLPCFVKANRAGSSYGISKVYKKEDLKTAIDISFKEDTQIIIEEFLDGTEVSVGVISYKGEVIVLPITEIVSENDFFDYEAKYLGQSQEITPARISKDYENKVKAQAKKIYETLGLTGFSRSEFIFKNDEPHLLEINTVPGLTKESILPQQAAKAGISLVDLFSNGIEEALKNN
ncbi:D-alanine--D-alanine ligase [Winogradskyella sp. A3E31]|uniref:D-alanine--D-alanine ligase n=1 Tax=Winogradskyella sp. A3E31 TaxID=3349637 RepID=UPI00398B0751